MFQNISKDFEENQNLDEDVELNRKTRIKEILENNLTKKQIILYIISFMLSFVCIGGDSDLAPFGIAVITAVLSNCRPIGMLSIITIIGTWVAFGGQSVLSFVLTLLILLVGILIKPPRYDEDSNEKRKLGFRIFFSCIVVKFGMLIIQSFAKYDALLIYDMLLVTIYSISAFVFYKIFVNSITVLTNIGSKQAYSVEEVMGASLLIAIAITALGDTSIFGFSLRNILCILIVLIMGWKNGILVGASSGVTIGAVIGIIADGEPMLIATYAISGMIAGIFSKFGKFGVILGFIIGNVILSYVANGNTADLIVFQEILIASIGLLAVPKNIKINIQDMYPSTPLLPETLDRNLEENQDTIYRLNSMSETISQIAKTYKEAAATIVDEKELQKQELKNLKIFQKELENNLEGLEENILFDDLYFQDETLQDETFQDETLQDEKYQEEFQNRHGNSIIEDIFKTLLNKEEIQKQDLINIFAKHNNYILGLETEEDTEKSSNDLISNKIINKQIEKDIMQIVKAINDAYRVSKLSFIWKKKIDENKKVVSSQLEEVSKAIGNLANEIEENTKIEGKDEFEAEKASIKLLLEQRDIQIKNINIKEMKNGRKQVTLYTDTCKDVDKPLCDIKKMSKSVSKVIGQEVMLQKQECGIRLNRPNCSYEFISQDTQKISIGVAKATKEESKISGDTSIQTRLEDGKYLLAISDGMGSGPKARKNSKMAIAMLEKLLSSGFDKDTSLRLINSTLNMAEDGEMYSTLDISILDLYAHKLEFIKNGACPTFIKNRRNVEILKSISLPTGIMDDIDLVVYDKDLNDGDIIVMCSDGIIESTTQYTNKELWVQFLLEELETEDSQKIADIILKEAIDNCYGKPKDDMTVMVAKISKITE